MQSSEIDKKRISDLAGESMKLSEESLLMQYRFFAPALSNIAVTEGSEGFQTDGRSIYYDPVLVLKLQRDDPVRLTRTYLHTILHPVFGHLFAADKLNPELWDLACDISTESAILSDLKAGYELDTDAAAKSVVAMIFKDAGGLSADRIYRYFSNDPPSERMIREYTQIFKRDSHTVWRRGPQEELFINEEMWKKISRQISAGINSSSSASKEADPLKENIELAGRKKVDYSAVLRRFSVSGEYMKASEDEFDYIYYTYGLETYGNMPLIEPLEYREDKKIKDFAIIIDTSASTKGETVSGFLRKTADILKNSDSYFSKVCIHILQCDSDVKSDIRITDREELENFIRNGKLTGMGATDFRPAFEYVDELVRNREFTDLKGVIYFTDGYGIYPHKAPGYDAVFAFPGEDINRPKVPAWAICTVLDEDDLQRAGSVSDTDQEN